MSERTMFTGCGTALVTPFQLDGSVDEPRVRALARRQIDDGVHFLVPCGTTGETPTLTLAERRRIVELVVEETGGRVPVLAGAGGYDTAGVVRAAREAAAAGAEGLLSVTPYYNKPTPDGLVAHYRAIADATPLPVIVYNVPGRTACNIDPPTLARLAEIPRVIGVKEASGNAFQIAEVCRIVPEDFIVLSGDDAMTLPAMAMGARGVVSVIANELPAEMSRLVELAEADDFAAAREIHRRLLPLMQGNFLESNPIPVKHVMAALGLLEERYRLPLVPARPETRERLASVLAELGLLTTPGTAERPARRPAASEGDGTPTEHANRPTSVSADGRPAGRALARGPGDNAPRSGAPADSERGGTTTEHLKRPTSVSAERQAADSAPPGAREQEVRR